MLPTSMDKHFKHFAGFQHSCFFLLFSIYMSAKAIARGRIIHTSTLCLDLPSGEVARKRGDIDDQVSLNVYCMFRKVKKI